MKKLSLLFTLISFCVFSQEKKFITPDLHKNQGVGTTVQHRYRYRDHPCRQSGEQRSPA